MSRWFVAVVIFSVFLGGSNLFSQADWLGFANNTSPQGRDGELQKRCGFFTRINVSGNASSFDELCQSIGRKCVRVCDWQGVTFSCNENTKWTPDGRVPGRDGTRVAFCPPAGSRALAPTHGSQVVLLTPECSCVGAVKSTNQVQCTDSNGNQSTKQQVCWTKKLLGTSTDCGTVCDDVYSVCNGTASGQCK